MNRLPARRCRRCDQLDDVRDVAEIAAAVIVALSAVFAVGTLVGAGLDLLWVAIHLGGVPMPRIAWLGDIPWATWAGVTAGCYWLGSSTAPRPRR